MLRRRRSRHFFLDLGKLTGDATYLEFNRPPIVRHLLDHATPTPGGGLKWPHAEHRIKPEYVYAQTGYMQGAAGIGMVFLRREAEARGKGWGCGCRIRRSKKMPGVRL